MNKAAIQRFAMKARTDLIEQVSQRAYQYGITNEGYGDANAVTVGGRALDTEEQKQRRELVEQIQRKGYTQVMEEVAYTWFNRFIALRFMEVNNYLPSHIRVFSDSTGAFKPEILNDVLHLDLPGLNMEKVAGYIESNQTEDLYRYLLLTQCNALNDALPQMFEKMGGYTELLLPNNILKQDSVLGHMVTDIEEADWTDQVQIIGWMYQYYNSELKDDTFALLKKNVKITKERIPSATQLFTPDWIVRYMVENSLGRVFIDKRKNEGVYGDGRGLDEMTWEEAEGKRIANEKYIAEQMDWKYYLPEAEQTQEVRKQLDEIQQESDKTGVKDIKVIDPCMGSGHILVYAFDVLVQIYKEYGISERDAVQSILENNLYGLDIDDRAAQLAYFAVMMKARQYDRRIFSRGVQPHVHTIMETNALGGSYKLAMGDFLLSKEHQETLNYLLDAFLDAKEYGSILQLEDRDYAGLMEAWKYTSSQTVENVTMSLWYSAVEYEIPKLIEQAMILTQKYDVVVTNPPYMGASGMTEKLSTYVKNHYADSKSDLFAVFIERCAQMAKPNYYQSMITMHGWMFLSGFESLRNRIKNYDKITMAHLGARGFEEISGEVVQTVAFIIRKGKTKDYRASYVRLVNGMTQQEKQELFLSGKKRYYVQESNFDNIPGHRISYWIDGVKVFGHRVIEDTFASGGRNKTHNNELYVRCWWEIGESIHSWKHYDNGGSSRKWYGNCLDIVDWSESARTFYASHGGLLKDGVCAKTGISWNGISGGKYCFKMKRPGFAFSSSSPTVITSKESSVYSIMGLLNSCVAPYILDAINPTLQLNVGEVLSFPVAGNDDDSAVISIVHGSIDLSKKDWDSFEISWDFLAHPLIRCKTVAEAYTAWEFECANRFNTLKSNEEELNRIFIDIYGLQDELTPEVENKDVTVRLADKKRDIRSLISYAVGCMFGRYSLDEPGLILAGYDRVEHTTRTYDGDDPELEKFATLNADGSKSYGSYYHWVNQERFKSFPIDVDNIIPICDDDYFDDDITGRFVKWVETVYGSETLEENLKFIADALGGKGTSREVIRSYFINDFYADHLKVYQKRPIYWLFDSGKKNGFKALIYMHRYQSDLLARMRTDYVHEQQERYRTQLAHLAEAIDHASASERVKLTKQQKKLQEQSLEIQKYEEKIHHLADQNIQIDLDDGVNHNYELFADVLAKRK